MKRLRLFLISDVAEDRDYDTFDSAVVAAYSKKEAQLIHPGAPGRDQPERWIPSHLVQVRLIGSATRGIKSGQVICASFNAG
jgi:hypothetical protein